MDTGFFLSFLLRILSLYIQDKKKPQNKPKNQTQKHAPRSPSLRSSLQVDSRTELRGDIEIPFFLVSVSSSFLFLAAARGSGRTILCVDTLHLLRLQHKNKNGAIAHRERKLNQKGRANAQRFKKEIDLGVVLEVVLSFTRGAKPPLLPPPARGQAGRVSTLPIACSLPSQGKKNQRQRPSVLPLNSALVLCIWSGRITSPW